MSGLAELLHGPDYDPDALPVERANAIIRSFVAPVAEDQMIPVRQALGRVLARDIVSPIDVPAHDNSAMDGFAVRSADLSRDGATALTEIGVAYAGKPFAGMVAQGQCVRIMTGAVMPTGADTVVVKEAVKAEGGRIIVPPGQEAGQHRRLAGEDLQRGKPALRAGTLIRPAELGLIASLGIGEVCVKRRLRVAFFSTGDELRSIGEPLASGELYDSNRFTIYGMLQRLGCEAIDMGLVRDDPALLEAAFRKAAENADAVITSGGVSAGEADFTKQMMAKLGDVVFWKIAMRPGRPMAFGRIGNGQHAAYLFGLPGNPVAVMVTFYHFVRGALLTMMGRNDTDLPLLRVKSASPTDTPPEVMTASARSAARRNAASN